MPKKQKTPKTPRTPKKDNQPVRASHYIIEESIELLPFLIKTLNKMSRNSVKSIMTRGQVTVDGKIVTQHNQELKPGQKVVIQDNKAAIKEIALMGIEIIHEDDDIIVIEKEEGMLSVATQQGYDVTAYSQLKQYVKQENPQNRVYIVHRLDRETSGLMIFAKNEKTKLILQENWKDLVSERLYTALVEGNVKKEKETITSWLTESKAFKIHSCPFDNGGKKAVTHYKKIRDNQNYSLLEVQLDTGRKNQIRVHMAEIGHPVVGDKKYGAKGNPMKRLGLHATTLGFTHPTTGKKMRFTTKVPKKFSLQLKEKKK
ncbi:MULTISPECIES: RluA family pseudouridine synthase [Vagococcus]|uniref:Pseudouridine synthase n=1 Tax=Vagococcus fluvialis bH819 TaxID=1255619 RepID=A0A1X6WKM5_9ENTE|nr:MULTISPECIES: RluA family pseudouridine synthase [Vagococcus]SLM84792.1 Ribosomal large subunit pseudouridine synthase D [Vagococcus fluvialis bH819]HCM89748.1 RluA family pseudouridine synthase [Vagococcus sp.]